MTPRRALLVGLGVITLIAAVALYHERFRFIEHEGYRQIRLSEHMPADLTSARRLARALPDPNVDPATGFAPLAWINGDFPDLTQALLESGADVDLVVKGQSLLQGLAGIPDESFSTGDFDRTAVERTLRILLRWKPNVCYRSQLADAYPSFKLTAEEIAHQPGHAIVGGLFDAAGVSCTKRSR